MESLVVIFLFIKLWMEPTIAEEGMLLAIAQELILKTEFYRGADFSSLQEVK